MANPVITIFEAYGSRAHEIGPALAQAFGVPFVDQHWSSAELSAAEAPEAEPLWNRVLTTLGATSSGLDAELNPMSLSRNEELARSQRQQVTDFAAAGAVLLGRNATVILADRPQTLHLKLYAPAAARIEMAAAAFGISRQEAEHRLEREDRIRVELSKRSFAWNPMSSSRYDLMLNTSVFDTSACVRLVQQAWTEKYGPRPPLNRG